MRCRAVHLAVTAVIWAVLPGVAAAQQGAAPGGAADVTAAQMTMSRPGPAARPALAPQPRPARMSGTHAPSRSLRPPWREGWAVPRLRWDDHPRGARWTAAVLGALRGHGAPLLDEVPRDIEHWCPAYPDADRGQRAAFWAGLISTLAWHESTHRPRAVGGGGRWFGLVQIAPGTARWRGCAVGTGQALLDGSANLRCGVRIMAATVPRDGVVADDMRGVAADWGPFHSRRKREDMRDWVRAQPYCQAPPPRPVMRPEGFLAARLRPLSGPNGIAFTRPVARPSAGPAP